MLELSSDVRIIDRSIETVFLEHKDPDKKFRVFIEDFIKSHKIPPGCKIVYGIKSIRNLEYVERVLIVTNITGEKTYFSFKIWLSLTNKPTQTEKCWKLSLLNFNVDNPNVVFKKEEEIVVKKRIKEHIHNKITASLFLLGGLAFFIILILTTSVSITYIMWIPLIGSLLGLAYWFNLKTVIIELSKHTWKQIMRVK